MGVLLELLRLALALALLVVLPGVALVNALFPQGVVRGAARLSVALSGGLLLLALVGSILGLLPHGGSGWFRTLATGAPFVEAAVLAVTVLLLYVGLARGAYPRVAARFPRLVNADARAPQPPRGVP